MGVPSVALWKIQIYCKYYKQDAESQTDAVKLSESINNTAALSLKSDNDKIIAALGVAFLTLLCSKCEHY